MEMITSLALGYSHSSFTFKQLFLIIELFHPQEFYEDMHPSDFFLNNVVIMTALLARNTLLAGYEKGFVNSVVTIFFGLHMNNFSLQMKSFPLAIIKIFNNITHAKYPISSNDSSTILLREGLFPSYMEMITSFALGYSHSSFTFKQLFLIIELFHPQEFYEDMHPSDFFLNNVVIMTALLARNTLLAGYEKGFVILWLPYFLAYI